MKKSTILILIIISIIIIVLIILGLILINNVEQKQLQEEVENTEIIVEENIIPVQKEEDFFSIEKIISNYYLYISGENKNALNNILSDNYKSKNSITDDNIMETIKNISGNGESFCAREIYYKEDVVNPIYLVYGIIEKEKKATESYTIVYIDNETSTYNIEPITKTDYENYKQKKSEMPLINSIDKKDYNTYNKVTLTEEDIINKYFQRYIKDSLYYTEYAYSKLNEEYRKAKFPMLQDYKIYVNGKSEELKSCLPEELKTPEDFKTDEEYTNYLYSYEPKGVDKYNVEEKDEYKQYTLIDDYGNYYILYVVSPMNYTIILDIYTVDLPEFTEKYNIAGDNGKVQLNIQRFFDAINDGNYSYAYSKLDETYKNSNFPTQVDFENYMKTNFYNRNKLAYTSYEKNGDLYIYKMVITNYENETQTIEKQFVIKLLEGTDFVMSFQK